MNTLITTLPPILLAFVTLLALLALGVLIWSVLPRRNARDADIERQIATLRRHADHAVATRPRVRANGYAGQAGNPRHNGAYSRAGITGGDAKIHKPAKARKVAA